MGDLKRVQEEYYAKKAEQELYEDNDIDEGFKAGIKTAFNLAKKQAKGLGKTKKLMKATFKKPEAVQRLRRMQGKKIISAFKR